MNSILDSKSAAAKPFRAMRYPQRVFRVMLVGFTVLISALQFNRVEAIGLTHVLCIIAAFAGEIILFLPVNNRFRHWLRLSHGSFASLLSVVLSIMVGLALLELTAQVVLLRLPTQPARLPLITFIRQYNDAYRDTPYYSEAFLTEFAKELGAERLTEEGVTLGGNFKGDYFNFVNDVRVTTDQPQHSNYTVYMFGSSVLLGQVPDSFTIASALQRMMPTYRVVNLGASAATVGYQLRQLKALRLAPGDMVIWLDGYMNAYAVYEKVRRTSGDCVNQQYTARNIALLKLACHLLGNPLMQFSASDVQTEAARFQRDADEARRYTQQQGGTFFHFLEPHLFSMPLSAYETVAYEQSAGALTEDKVLLPLMWAAFKRPSDYDLTHVLDQYRAAGHAVHIDDHHVTDKANEIIAQVMYNAIFTF